MEINKLKININKLFDYISKTETLEEAVYIIKQLQRLQESRKRLGIYSEQIVRDNGIGNALKYCAKFLTKTDKERTYL